MDPNALIARVAAQQLGGPPAPAQPPTAVAPAPAPAPAPPMPPPGPGPDTAEAKAQKDAAPQTEGDKMAENPVVYELKSKDGKVRKITPEQIEGMSSRYAALNHKHATMKPIIDLAEHLMRQNPNATPADLAEAVIAMSRAQQHNPVMGRGSAQQVADQNGVANPLPEDENFSNWERENAAKLPPGYKEMFGQMRQMGQQFQQQQSLLQQLLNQSAGVADGVRTVAEDTRTQQVQAAQQGIANNLDRAQMALQIPGEKANDFMVWAGERGYMLEDFSDPNLTYKVMNDFKNDVNSGEMERLRAINARRQSFTGLGNATPSGGAAPAASPEQAQFKDFAARVMSKRGIG